MILYGEEYNYPGLKCLLSHGLEFIQGFIHADSYEAQRELLSPLLPNHRTCQMWYDAEDLTLWVHWPEEEMFLSEYSPQDEWALNDIHSPFFPDPNSGPADAWRWAHQNETVRGFIFSPRQVALRSRGYCVWDRARLDKWTIFQGPWQPPQNPHRGPEQKSLKAQLAIWCEGKSY